MTIFESTELNGMIKESIIVMDESILTFNGNTMFDIEVTMDSKLILNGTMFGNLMVDKSSEAEIHGTLKGNIYGGGKVIVYGEVDYIEPLPDEVVVEPGAKVKKLAF